VFVKILLPMNYVLTFSFFFFFCCCCCCCDCFSFTSPPLTHTEGYFDGGGEEGTGEFDSFVEPASLVLSSFIEKHLMEGTVVWPGEGS
jgi:hypothetical protein